MKRIIAIVAVLSSLAAVGSAGALPKYCGTTPYDVQYRAIYEYPSGTYWQNQIAHYPAYYAAHDAQFQAKYGC